MEKTVTWIMVGANQKANEEFVYAGQCRPTWFSGPKGLYAADYIRTYQVNHPQLKYITTEDADSWMMNRCRE